MTGNWRLLGDVVEYTVMKSSFKNEEVSGQVMYDRIKSINDTTLVLQNDTSGGVVFRNEIADGEISTWIREN